MDGFSSATFSFGYGAKNSVVFFQAVDVPLENERQADFVVVATVFVVDVTGLVIQVGGVRTFVGFHSQAPSCALPEVNTIEKASNVGTKYFFMTAYQFHLVTHLTSDCKLLGFQ